MGLCKCPKKRVTQQFCYEHRVNVCEFCMVDSHQSCIVQPYIRWLGDGTYKSICSFCQLPLNKEECIRLLCFHVFHWTCLNKHCSNLPLNTAPGGYTCPDCNCSIFPSNDTPSPIFAVLKKKLSTTEWARIGLFLPKNFNDNKNQQINLNNNLNNNLNIENNLHQSFESNNKNLTTNIIVYHKQNNSPNSQSVPVTINNIGNDLPNNYINNNLNSFNTSSRKMINNRYLNETDSLIVDIDEDKYRQRSNLERLSRYLKFYQYDKNLKSYQKWVVFGVIIFIFLFTFLHYLIKLGRETADNDPLLDPKYNPNIHVDENINRLD